MINVEVMAIFFRRATPIERGGIREFRLQLVSYDGREPQVEYREYILPDKAGDFPGWITPNAGVTEIPRKIRGVPISLVSYITPDVISQAGENYTGSE